jgi:hypothetical protein
LGHANTEKGPMSPSAEQKWRDKSDKDRISSAQYQYSEISIHSEYREFARKTRSSFVEEHIEIREVFFCLNFYWQIGTLITMFAPVQTKPDVELCR